MPSLTSLPAVYGSNEASPSLATVRVGTAVGIGVGPHLVTGSSTQITTGCAYASAVVRAQTTRISASFVSNFIFRLLFGTHASVGRSRVHLRCRKTSSAQQPECQ